jgi:hypothetical protein
VKPMAAPLTSLSNSLEAKVQLHSFDLVVRLFLYCKGMNCKFSQYNITGPAAMVFGNGSTVRVCLQDMHSLSAPNDNMHGIVNATRAATSSSMKGCFAVLLHFTSTKPE